MPRCTGPRSAAARASSCSTRTRAGGRSRGSSSRRRSGRRSTAPSCASTTSRGSSLNDDHRRVLGRGAGPLGAPRRGLIEPDEFMPLADDTGSATAIGEFVLEQALDQLARWRTSKPEMRLSLGHVGAPAAGRGPRVGAERRDPRQRRRPRRDLPGGHRGSRRRGSRGASPDASRAQGDRGAARARRLRIGRRVVLPAARSCRSTRSRSTTASSASSDESDEDASIVGALVELGHALGLGVVAEGVETEAQLEQLRELGCDAAQGYLIGPPADRGADRRAAGRRGRVARAVDASARHARSMNPLPRTVLISGGSPSLRRRRVT